MWKIGTDTPKNEQNALEYVRTCDVIFPLWYPIELGVSHHSCHPFILDSLFRSYLEVGLSNGDWLYLVQCEKASQTVLRSSMFVPCHS